MRIELITESLLRILAILGNMHPQKFQDLSLLQVYVLVPMGGFKPPKP